MNNHYTLYDTTNATAEAKPILEATEARLKVLPNLVRAMAGSHQLIGSFLQLTQTAQSLTLKTLEREVVSMTVATVIGCEHCVAQHLMTLQRLRAPETLVRALRSGGPIADDRLAALRDFTRAVIEERGAASDELQERFFDAGFTAQQALEVVFMVGMLTMSTYASRLTRVPLDEAMQAALAS